MYKVTVEAQKGPWASGYFPRQFRYKRDALHLFGMCKIYNCINPKLFVLRRKDWVEITK